MSAGVPEGLWDKIPTDVQKRLPEELRSFAKGESDTIPHGGVSSAFGTLGDLVRDVISSNLKPLYLLLGYVLIVGATTAICGSVAKEGTAAFLNFLSAVCLSLAVYSLLTRAWSGLESALRTVTVFTDSMLPVMSVLYITGGNPTVAAVNEGVTAVLLSAVGNLCSGGLYPVLRVCYGFSVLEHVCPELKLNGIGDLIRKLFTTLLGAAMAVFSCILTFQTALGRSTDSVGVRTVKFAAGKLIPLVGSSIGEAAQTLFAGISYVRTGVGITAIVVIALIVIPPVLTLFWYKLIFGFCGAACAATGGERAGAFLHKCGELLNFGIAILCASGLVLTLVFVLFVRTVSAYA